MVDTKGNKITTNKLKHMSSKKLIISAVVFVLALIILIAMSPFTTIQPGHRGVAIEFGKVQDTVLSEGFHLINPFWEIKKYDVRVQKVEDQVSAASKDLQTVQTTVAVNFRVNPDSVRSLYQETSGRYEQTLIAPAIEEAVKATTAQFTADELVTKRSEVKQTMRDELSSREGMKFFTLDDVSIVDFSFSASFNQAIENKVQAEQDALAAKNKLEQVKFEAEQKVVAAEAEAESIRIQAEALKQSNDLIELEAVRRWDGKLPQYLMGDSVPFINLK